MSPALTNSPPEILPLADRVEGVFEEVRANDKGVQWASGWARDPAAPGKAVIVDLFAGDMLLVSGYAARLREHAPGARSVCGFRMPLPPNFSCGETIRLTAKVRSRHGGIEIGSLDVRRAPFGRRLDGPGSGPSPIPHPAHPGRSGASRAAIILTRDGSAVLGALLESILLHEPTAFRRIVVVDHSSIDDTGSVIERFARHLPIELLPLPRENSFSRSNNAAAATCDEDVLFFLNNDIVLTSPIVDAMASHLDDATGLVGLRLMDPPANQADPPLQATQHVGVHFWPTPIGIRPIESRWLSDISSANRLAVEAPAVTAAFVAVRRSVFERLGGFCEGYFFGLEDADLCLRSRALGLRNVSVNDVSAIHVGSYTRGPMAGELEKRAAQNTDLFNARCGYALRRSLVSEQFERPGFWTGRSLHFGFVVSDRDAGARRAAEALGAALPSLLPAKAFLHDSAGPVDASDLDVVVVTDPAFDVRKLARLGTTAWLTAWAGDDLAAWDRLPWREQFDSWFSTAEGLAVTNFRAVRNLTPLPCRPDAGPTAGQDMDACARLFLSGIRVQAASGLRVSLSAEALSKGAGNSPAYQLRRELEALGHTVRLRAPGEPKRFAARDDAVIVASVTEEFSRKRPQIRILLGTPPLEENAAVSPFDRVVPADLSAHSGDFRIRDNRARPVAGRGPARHRPQEARLRLTRHLADACLPGGRPHCIHAGGWLVLSPEGSTHDLEQRSGSDPGHRRRRARRRGRRRRPRERRRPDHGRLQGDARADRLHDPPHERHPLRADAAGRGGTAQPLPHGRNKSRPDAHRLHRLGRLPRGPDDRHFGGRAHQHAARARQRQLHRRRFPPPRPRLPADQQDRRRADPLRPHRGGDRSRPARRAGGSRRARRGRQRRRHGEAPAAAHRLRPGARAEDRLDRRPDRAPHPHGILREPDREFCRHDARRRSHGAHLHDPLRRHAASGRGLRRSERRARRALPHPSRAAAARPLPGPALAALARQRAGAHQDERRRRADLCARPADHAAWRARPKRQRRRSGTGTRARAPAWSAGGRSASARRSCAT